MNKAAQALGKLAAGKPKKYSAEEIAARTKRLAEARKKRWSIAKAVFEPNLPKEFKEASPSKQRKIASQAIGQYLAKHKKGKSK